MMQVMRSIDKWDRLGRTGVYDLLTTGRTDESGAFVPGCGIHPAQAGAICAFVGQDFGVGIEGMEKWFGRIGSRFHLMIRLEETVTTDGTTAWDRLLAMPVNEDDTWSDGRRPANIGWALDDIIILLSKTETK